MDIDIFELASKYHRIVREDLMERIKSGQMHEIDHPQRSDPKNPDQLTDHLAIDVKDEGVADSGKYSILRSGGATFKLPKGNEKDPLVSGRRAQSSNIDPKITAPELPLLSRDSDYSPKSPEFISYMKDRADKGDPKRV